MVHRAVVFELSATTRPFPEYAMSQDILLIHENPDVIKHFQKEFENNGTRITSMKASKALTKKPQDSDHFVVIAAEGDWARELKILQKMKKDKEEFYAIVSSPSMLQKTVAQIHETALHLNLKNGSGNDLSPTTANPQQEEKGHEPNLADLVEKKLTQFVQKIKNCEVKNLYSLLIREFEKPLITLALKETKGNQIQAAQLLGVNRNTLRKKMKELKISVIKNKNS
jgi:two-component system nitrogen regulation response regulator GlnG